MRHLSEIEIALQRIADNARTRSDDIKYAQRQEDNEHVYMLDHALALVDKVRASLLEDRARFIPAASHSPRVTANGPKPQDKPIPSFLKQGPTEAQ